MSSPSSGYVNEVKLRETTDAHTHVRASTHKHMSRCTDTHTGSCVSGREDISLCALARMHLQTCGPEQVQLTHANRQNAYIKTQGVSSGSRWPDALERYCWVSRRRPGVQGSRQGGPTPRETQVHEWGGWMGEGSGCESMASTAAAHSNECRSSSMQHAGSCALGCAVASRCACVNRLPASTR